MRRGELVSKSIEQELSDLLIVSDTYGDLVDQLRAIHARKPTEVSRLITSLD